MDQPSTREKIAPFIAQYELDQSEFLCDVKDFASFNEFFFRKLKPQARPIDTARHPWCFRPMVAICVPDLSQCDGLFVKGEMFSLEKLLQDRKLVDRYAKGSLLLSRLCPVDYHRFHFPAAGVPGQRG